jgi:hypothetical protein
VRPNLGMCIIALERIVDDVEEPTHTHPQKRNQGAASPRWSPLQASPPVERATTHLPAERSTSRAKPMCRQDRWHLAGLYPLRRERASGFCREPRPPELAHLPPASPEEVDGLARCLPYALGQRNLPNLTASS